MAWQGFSADVFIWGGNIYRCTQLHIILRLKYPKTDVSHPPCPHVVMLFEKSQVLQRRSPTTNAVKAGLSLIYDTQQRPFFSPGQGKIVSCQNMFHSNPSPHPVLFLLVTGRPAADIPDHDDDKRVLGRRGSGGCDRRCHAVVRGGHGPAVLRVPQGHELLPSGGERAQASRLHYKV